MAEGLEWGDPRSALIEEDHALVVSREGARREIVLRKVMLKDFSIAWMCPVGEAGMTLLSPSATAEHIGIVTFDRGENGKFCYSISLVDQAGSKVQNIRSEFQYERPPNYSLANGMVVITVESAVRVYR
jgi:hypothetical protein